MIKSTTQILDEQEFESTEQVLLSLKNAIEEVKKHFNDN